MSKHASKSPSIPCMTSNGRLVECKVGAWISKVRLAFGEHVTKVFAGGDMLGMI